MTKVSAEAVPAPDSGDIWTATARRAADCGYFFDFDGTLAPIGDDPEEVHPVPGALEALSELTGRVRRVSIVSARPVQFLRQRLGDVPQLALFGLYGLEWQIGAGPIATHPEASAFEPVMREVTQRASAELPGAVLVEYKRLSVALHYRAAPDLREQVETWAGRCAERLQLRVQAGRMVVEIKPPGNRDKGSVVTELIADLTCAWYFGDDLSDLRAFAALDSRRAADPAFLGVRVMVANPESGHHLRSSADVCIDAPELVPDFLANGSPKPPAPTSR
ncbi:MAG: trehalose-phosphatase [Dactylosporangium sp.]|nr:trehalose-phosphatase [Dactylosporangium sp.]NNJ61950.1 trehalose-phosphatase [Dactylosporangium sp.]